MHGLSRSVNIQIIEKLKTAIKFLNGLFVIKAKLARTGKNTLAVIKVAVCKI